MGPSLLYSRPAAVVLIPHIDRIPLSLSPGLFQMRLWNKYKVTSVPSLVFVDATTGKVVCRNGLLVVRDDPKGES